MQLVERLNKTIEYLEENLCDEVDYKRLSEIACCFTFHYQRMFAYMVGISVTEYVKRRRMSNAALDLQSSEKVIDVALKL